MLQPFQNTDIAKKFMKDSSSLIILKSFEQFAPYAYHPVLVIFNLVHNIPERIENAH